MKINYKIAELICSRTVFYKRDFQLCSRNAKNVAAARMTLTIEDRVTNPLANFIYFILIEDEI